MEPAGRLRPQASTAARTRRRAGPTCSKLLTDHVPVQDKSGREALQNFIAGNGDVLLSYENEATTAQKKGQAVDYVLPGRHDQDRTSTSRRPPRRRARPRRSSTTCSPSPARSASPTGATGRSTRRSCSRTSEVPDAAGPVHDRGPRRLDEGQRRVLRPRERARRQDRGGRGGLHGQVSTRLAAAPLRRRGRAVGRALGVGIATLWLSVIVLLPLAARRRALARRRLARSGTR